MADKKKNSAEPRLDKLRLFNRPIKMLPVCKIERRLPKTDLKNLEQKDV